MPWHIRSMSNRWPNFVFIRISKLAVSVVLPLEVFANLFLSSSRILTGAMKSLSVAVFLFSCSLLVFQAQSQCLGDCPRALWCKKHRRTDDEEICKRWRWEPPRPRRFYRGCCVDCPDCCLVLPRLPFFLRGQIKEECHPHNSNGLLNNQMPRSKTPLVR